MIWRFWNRTSKRRAHKSPSLRVVREERDQAVALARELRMEIEALKRKLGRAEDHRQWLQARVALLENAHTISVPAPMELDAPTVPVDVSQLQDHYRGNVVPLWRSPLTRTGRVRPWT